MNFEANLYIKLSIYMHILKCISTANSGLENSAFSLDLFERTINVNNDTQNIIVSPLSIQTILALASTGAKGKTAKELFTGLRIFSSDKGKHVSNIHQFLSRSNAKSLVTLVNRIYVKQGVGVKPIFNEIATEKFYSQAENIDFRKSEEAAKIINNWVDEKTHHKIQNFVEPSSIKGVAILLTNAIYFNGKWKNKFDPDRTRTRKFYNNKESSVDVKMMYIYDDFKYTELTDLDAKAIQLPYNNSDLYMLIILPNKKTGLKEMAKRLNHNYLLEIEKNMQTSDVQVGLPKFRTEFSIELNDVLKQMGMITMFNEDANFDEMLYKKIKISNVYHKAVVIVDEAGTEAAAATNVEDVALLSLSLKHKTFKVDRPFLYYIKDSELIYFIGRVSKL